MSYETPRQTHTSPVQTVLPMNGMSDFWIIVLFGVVPAVLAIGGVAALIYGVANYIATH